MKTLGAQCSSVSARKIPKNRIFVTGAFSSRKNEAMDSFESLLEKDYLLLLDFDDEVESFEPQPVRIPVPRVANGYVPDVLVTYRSAPRRLVEVKPSSELQRNAKKYEPKFRAASTYADERGWVFEVVDERRIRTPRLANLKFLREYRNVEPNPSDIAAVLRCKAWKNKNTSSSEVLLRALAKSTAERLHWLPVIWAMVVRGELATDLNVPFAHDVPLSLQGAVA